jgi:hypothetical protein
MVILLIFFCSPVAAKPRLVEYRNYQIFGFGGRCGQVEKVG